MPQVASRVISHIDYNAPSRELHIIFASGRAYTYLGVPVEVYHQFCRAPSKGEFFNLLIRNRYPYSEQERWISARTSPRQGTTTAVRRYHTEHAAQAFAAGQSQNL